MQEKVPTRYEYVHSVRSELAKLELEGTRITYQATGDAEYRVYVCIKKGEDNKWDGKS